MKFDGFKLFFITFIAINFLYIVFHFQHDMSKRPAESGRPVAPKVSRRASPSSSSSETPTTSASAEAPVGVLFNSELRIVRVVLSRVTLQLN